jgi:hypothetical protein
MIVFVRRGHMATLRTIGVIVLQMDSTMMTRMELVRAVTRGIGGRRTLARTGVTQISTSLLVATSVVETMSWITVMNTDTIALHDRGIAESVIGMRTGMWAIDIGHQDDTVKRTVPEPTVCHTEASAFRRSPQFTATIAEGEKSPPLRLPT